MLNKLITLFEVRISSFEESGQDQDKKTLEFAAAILMLEISRADSSIDADERRVIDAALVNHFHLSKQEAEDVLKLAEEEVDHTVSLHEFTRLVNDRLSQEAKVKIIELLWQVAFADGVLDKYEEYFIRKIADLLYVSHKDYIRTKHIASTDGKD